MAFSAMSNLSINRPCNNGLFTLGTIPPMHESMERLYEAARRLRGVEEQTPLANALNVSPQVVNNWETRGISDDGAIRAQREIGCNAVWITTGEGPWSLDLPLSQAVRERVASLDVAGLIQLENLVRAHLGMPVLNPDAPPPAAHRLRSTAPNQNVIRSPKLSESRSKKNH